MGTPFRACKFSGSTCSGVSCEYFKQKACCSPNDAEFHSFGFRRHLVGRACSPCTPVMNRFSGSPFSPITDSSRCVERSSSCSSHYVGRDPPQKLVILYNWYLIKVGDSCIENGINPNGIQVAVGGHMQSGENFETGPIEYREEKCKLRTVDGLNVLLIGAINEQYTYNNGFPFNAIHIFFTGFPFNWNHIIIQCFVRPSLDTILPSACSIKESTSQEKSGVLSEFPVVQMDIAGTGKLNLQEPKQNLLNEISPRESVLRCTKRGRSESQPLRSSKRLKGDTGRTESEPTQQGFSKCLDSQINVDSIKNVTCILRSTVPQNRNGHKQIKDQIGGARLLEPATTGKIEIGHAKEENDDSFTSKEDGAYNRSPISNLQNKIFEESNDNYYSVVKQKIESGTSAVEHTFEDQTPDLEIPVIGIKMQRHRYACKSTVNKNRRSKGSSNCRKVSPKVPSTLLLDEAIVKDSIQRNSDGIDANHSEDLGKKNTSAWRRRRISAVNKMWRSKSRSSWRKRSRVPRTFLLDKGTVKNDMRKNSNGVGEDCDKELCKGSMPMALTFKQAFENRTAFLVDTEHQDFGCRKGSNETNSKEQVENNFADLQNSSSVSEQAKSSPLVDSHLHSDVNKVEKCVRNSNTKRGRNRKGIPKHTDLFCMESEGRVSDEATVFENMKQKSEDISEISAGSLDPIASESRNDKLSGHCMEIGGNTSKKKSNQGPCVVSVDNLETGKTDTERDVCSGQVKRQQCVTRKPHPLPSPRVQTTPEEVSKAFGLKTSRSGRLLVPPLAHWCNQAIAYDLDGGIIAIFDGSTERKNDHGCFKPPKQPEAVKIQQKLYNAANEIIRTPKGGKRAGVQIKD